MPVGNRIVRPNGTSADVIRFYPDLIPFPGAPVSSFHTHINEAQVVGDPIESGGKFLIAVMPPQPQGRMVPEYNFSSFDMETPSSIPSEHAITSVTIHVGARVIRNYDPGRPVLGAIIWVDMDAGPDWLPISASKTHMSGSNHMIVSGTSHKLPDWQTIGTSTDETSWFSRKFRSPRLLYPSTNENLTNFKVTIGMSGNDWEAETSTTFSSMYAEFHYAPRFRVRGMVGG